MLQVCAPSVGLFCSSCFAFVAVGHKSRLEPRNYVVQCMYVYLYSAPLISPCRYKKQVISCRISSILIHQACGRDVSTNPAASRPVDLELAPAPPPCPPALAYLLHFTPTTQMQIVLRSFPHHPVSRTSTFSVPLLNLHLVRVDAHE
jgi:hypothetical protein